MNKYKVEFIRTESFVIDVLAENEDEAQLKAYEEFYNLDSNGTLHYYSNGDEDVTVGTAYDVTNTDDPFNP